jgi:hypothetical protein
MTTLVLFTVAVMALAMTGMAVGVMFSNKCLRGSCGGPEILGPDGKALNCDTCPHKVKVQES